MSLKETMQNWKQQAEDEAERNLNRQGQNSEHQKPSGTAPAGEPLSVEPPNETPSNSTSENQQMIALTPTELQNLIESAAAKAVEEKIQTEELREADLETKLNRNDQQLNQFRLQQLKKNKLLQKETDQLKADTKASFDGLGDLIQEKLKPLEEFNRNPNRTKQLPPKKADPSRDGRRMTESNSPKPNTSDNRQSNDNSSYSISHPSVSYIPSQTETEYYQRHPRRAASTSPEPGIRLTDWMERTDRLFQIPRIILWLIFQLFRGMWAIFKAIIFLTILAPEVMFPLFLIITAVLMGVVLYWGVPYLLAEPKDHFMR